MKAGNSILAVFFFYMAFRIPMEINTLSLSYDIYDIPGIDFYKILSVILFGVCIILGVVSLEYGRESRKTTNVKISNSKMKDVKIPDEKKINDLPDSSKNSISDVGKGAVTKNHVVANTVSEVDKSLPVLKVVDDNENDDFKTISDKINNVIGN